MAKSGRPSVRSAERQGSRTPADRRARAEALRAAQRAKERRSRVRIAIAGGVVIAALAALIAVTLLAGRTKTDAERIPTAPTGTAVSSQAVVDPKGKPLVAGATVYVTAARLPGALARDHVANPVNYGVTPPVGGQHNATWLTCGIYDKPVPSENAVHDMEHGAVWITYQPTLAAADVQKLRGVVTSQPLTGGSHYVDLTPFPGLQSPVVVTAWGVQLRVQSATDPRIAQFVSAYRLGPQTPEPGATCVQGAGTPLTP